VGRCCRAGPFPGGLGAEEATARRKQRSRERPRVSVGAGRQTNSTADAERGWKRGSKPAIEQMNVVAFRRPMITRSLGTFGHQCGGGTGEMLFGNFVISALQSRASFGVRNPLSVSN